MVRLPRPALVVLLWTIVLAASPPSHAAPPPRAGLGGPVQIQECGVIDVPGSYILVNNLPGAAGLLENDNCLEITADYVTLDLGGFVITCNQHGAGVVYLGSLPEYVHGFITVRNGTVRECFDGVSLDGGKGHTVEGVRAFNNEHYGISVDAQNCNVIGNTAEFNSGTAIRAGDSCNVRDNVATTNGFNALHGETGDGIRVGTGGTVTGNTVTDNFHFGIFVSSSSTVSGNTATDNGSSGIAVGGHSNVSGNTATDNYDIGIVAGEHSNVSGNVASRNGLELLECGDDIVVTCPALITNNKAEGAIIAIGNPGVANCASPSDHNFPIPAFWAPPAPCPVP